MGRAADEERGVVEVQIGEYHLRIFEDGVPADWTALREHAALFGEY
jgi:hypothetical protein